MSPSRDSSNPPSPLARYTPDSRRWRHRVAGLAAIGAPLSLYATVAIISGASSGMAYNLLVLLFGLLAMALPAVTAASLLAPNSGLTRTDASPTDVPRTADAVEALKRRYATGDIDQAEFDRRLGDLMEATDAAREEADGDSVGTHATRDVERDQAGR